MHDNAQCMFTAQPLVAKLVVTISITACRDDLVCHTMTNPYSSTCSTLAVESAKANGA